MTLRRAVAVSRNIQLHELIRNIAKDVFVADDLDEARAWILFSGLIIIGYFMVSRWKFPSVKTLRVPVATFEKVFLLVLLALLIFYGIVNHFPLALFIGAWG